VPGHPQGEDAADDEGPTQGECPFQKAMGHMPLQGIEGQNAHGHDHRTAQKNQNPHGGT